MTLKKLTLVSALVAIAMTAACGDKQENAAAPADGASMTQAAAAGNASDVKAAAPATQTPLQAEQATQQQLATVPPPAPDADGLTRVHFDEVFSRNADGSFSPKVPVDINGVQMTPGVTFGGAVQFGGFALSQAANHDLGVRRLSNGFIQLVKYYS